MGDGRPDAAMKPLRTRRDPGTLLGGKAYVPSTHTDVAATLARVRAELAAKLINVSTIKRRKA